MSLHGNPNNRESGTYTKAWQNYFHQVQHQITQMLNSIRDNFVGTSNDINSKRAFLPHDPWIFFELVASTAANSALTITKKLGQRVLAIVVEESNLILAGQVFTPRPPRPDRIKAGTDITITRKLGEVTIASTAAPTTYYEPVTNGDPVFPEIMFDGNGDVIMDEVPIP